MLGNHDVLNVSLGNRACGRYAPNSKGAKVMGRTAPATGRAASPHPPTSRQGVHETGQGGGRRKGHRFREERATHVAGVHGGLADTEALVQTFGIAPGQHEDNVRRINRVYRQAVLTGKNIDELDGDCMPTWCRPTRVENPEDLRKYFGTARVVKAHDVQGTANCNLDGARRTSRHDVMEDGELCRIDVMMSRSFEKGRVEREKEFACVKLEARQGRMYRTILRATETLDRHLEYPAYVKL